MKKTIKLADQEVLYNLITNRHILAEEIVIDTEKKVADIVYPTRKAAARYATSELGVFNLDTNIKTPLEKYKVINNTTLTEEQKEIIERLLNIGNSIQTAATEALSPKATKMDIIVALAFARDLKIEAYETTSEKTQET